MSSLCCNVDYMYMYMYARTRFQFTVPWLSFVKSPAVWAIVMMHMCANWTTYTFLTNMPTYIKEVLKFDVKSVATVYDML